MKVTQIALSLLLGANIASARSWFQSVNQKVLDDPDLSVPGNNPLQYCEKPDGWLLDIDSADIDPNPPTPGKELKIGAKGKLSDDILEGAKIHVSVAYGYIKLINQDFDLCELSKEADLECPIKKGDLELSKAVDLPKEIPPGKYTVVANVTTKDDKPITCLQAQVTFSRG